ncbi:MAG: mitochondrial fission ELM1 family protein, partial [Candidatus Omnitrophica bacterium]|nr:mitochondrial fission ELM1 family protein [Candidatus Omnitrophota bacterium]
EGAAKLISRKLADRGIKTHLFVGEVKFRRPLSGLILSWVAGFSGKYRGQGGSLRYLRYALTSESWRSLMSFKPDIIISAGGAISAVNYLLAKENQAKSVVLMRPANLSLKKFNLAIIPRHDQPVSGSNLVITEGALNLIDADYLSQKTKGLEQSGLIKSPLIHPCIGVLIGGNSKRFFLGSEQILALAKEIKKSAEGLNADILISTSRRSTGEVEEVIKNEFSNYARCKLLVIARQNNNPDVVGGILGLSNIIVTSPESISMISEAVCAKKYVIVFNSGKLSAKHQRFLKNYQNKKYIYVKQTEDLAGFIKEIWQNHPEVNFPEDNLRVSAALDKIL